MTAHINIEEQGGQRKQQQQRGRRREMEWDEKNPQQQSKDKITVDGLDCGLFKLHKYLHGFFCVTQLYSASNKYFHCQLTC